MEQKNIIYKVLFKNRNKITELTARTKELEEQIAKKNRIIDIKNEEIKYIDNSYEPLLSQIETQRQIIELHDRFLETLGGHIKCETNYTDEPYGWDGRILNRKYIQFPRFHIGWKGQPQDIVRKIENLLARTNRRNIEPAWNQYDYYRNESLRGLRMPEFRMGNTIV